MLAVAVEREEAKLVATPDTVVEGGDVLTFFSLERPSDELVDKLTG
jgi:hypothetical protein